MSPMPAFEEFFDPEMLRRLLPGVGLHPDDVLSILRYVPLGLESMWWRNTVLEDWHASGRLDDADMFRNNTQTASIFNYYLWDGLSELVARGLFTSQRGIDEADDIVDILDEALYQALTEAFDDDRELASGGTLGDLGGDELMELQDHATNQFHALMEQASKRGVWAVLAFLAMKGRGASRFHWMAPEWPLLVDNFMKIAYDPEHEWWARAQNSYPDNLPEGVRDPAIMRDKLLRAPWELSHEAAGFCVWTVGIEFTRPMDF